MTMMETSLRMMEVPAGYQRLHPVYVRHGEEVAKCLSVVERIIRNRKAEPSEDFYFLHYLRAKLRRINGMLKGMPDDVVYLDDKDLATVKNVADWCRENL